MIGLDGYDNFRTLCIAFNKIKGDSIVQYEPSEHRAIFRNDTKLVRAVCSLGNKNNVENKFTANTSDIVQLIKFIERNKEGQVEIKSSSIIGRSNLDHVSYSIRSETLGYPEKKSESKIFEMNDPVAIRALCKVFAATTDSWSNIKETSQIGLLFGKNYMACCNTKMAIMYENMIDVDEVIIRSDIWRFYDLVKNGFEIYVDKRGLYVLGEGFEICFPGRFDSTMTMEHVLRMFDDFDYEKATVISLKSMKSAIDVAKGKGNVDIVMSGGNVFLKTAGLSVKIEGQATKEGSVTIPVARLLDSIKGITQAYNLKDGEIDLFLGRGLMFSYEDIACVIAKTVGNHG